MPSITSSLPILTQRSSQRPTSGRKGSCQQSRGQRNLVGLARAAQQQTLSTTARVLALVRKRWFSKPLSICRDDAGILCPNSRLAGRVIRVMGREILLLTAYFEHSVGFRSDTNANLMQDVCFLTRDGRFPFILGADFNFPPSLWQDLTLHGGGIWIKQLGASVVIPQGSSHTCRTGRGQKPDIIDYFMVSACIRPLIQRCEVIKSVPWGPHYGVKLVLNIDFESVLSRQLVGKSSRRSHYKVGATLEGSDADLLEEADPSLWEAARLKCRLEGRKPRCSLGQETAEAACSQYANAVGTLEESNELGHALETWSDATAQYWACSGRVGQLTLSDKFAKFRLKPVLGETFMPLGCVILEGGGNAELRAWKAFGQWIKIIRKALPVTDPPEHARYAARKIVNFIQGSDTLSMKVMDDLSTTKRWSLVEESTLLVLSFLRREGSGAQCYMLTERVRRLAERVLQKGIEYSRRATHKWLSQALKGGAAPALRWCGKEDALPDLPLIIRDNQGHFTADPQSVAEHYAKEWKREWRDVDKKFFDNETSSIRDLRVKHVAEAHEWARNLDLSATSIRKACLSFPSKSAIGLDQHAFKDIALLPDNALGSLGEIIRQCFVKLAIPTQSLLQLLVLLGEKNGGSRTIAILHTTYRLTMRLVSAHISQWDVNFAGKWDSALKGNSVLRAHVARAEGQFVIHFLWDMRKSTTALKRIC